MFDYLESLNEAQREAVLRTEGPSLIIAGAGSGKTRVLTYRIAHLLKQGVRSSSVLALTFTNKAAGEMKSRIASLVGEEKSSHLWMGTFHSVFARILRFEHEATGFPSDYTIYDAADSRNLVKTVLRHFDFDDKVYKPGVVAKRISMAKNNLITPAGYLQSAEMLDYDRRIRMPRIQEVYQEYMKRCKLSNAMDFDDLLLMTYLLFRNHPEILDKYRHRFDYILVDEYQDTNYAQYLIIRELAALHNNLCVVGDDAQSIYSFRGARIENIFNFRNDYPAHKVFKLEQNYRSTQTIVNAANSLIAHNKRQIRKTVFSRKEEGQQIRVLQALTDTEEGFRVAGVVAEILLRDHLRNDDLAILYRTNAQSRIFEESLRRRNIPYKVYGGLSFYQRKEVKDLLAYFRVITNPDDNEALKRIINYPARGIGQTTLSKLESVSAASEQSIWTVIGRLPEGKELSFNSGTAGKLGNFRAVIDGFRELAARETAFQLARTVAGETGIMRELYNDRSPEGLSRYENLEELLNSIRIFNQTALEEGRSGGIGGYLQEVALLTDQDNEKEADRNKVALMTVHAAKGLEFKVVFIVGLERNLFPAVSPGEQITEEELEEERRLFYVGLTRARQQVYLSYALQRYRWGKTEDCEPSRFLEEIDREYLEPAATGLIRPAERPAARTYPSGTAPRGGSLPEITPGLRSSFQKKISLLNREENSNREFNETSQESIQPGMVVEHPRFGTGRVLQVEGLPPDRMATVFFQNAGQKQLLLRFAKLRIIP